MSLKLKTHKKTLKNPKFVLKDQLAFCGMAFQFSPIASYSPVVLHSMNTPHSVCGQYCLPEHMVIVFPRKSFQLCDLVDFNRAIYCNLDVSMPSLSYSLQSKTNRNSFFLICGAREIPLTSVFKLDVLLAWLVKIGRASCRERV